MVVKRIFECRGVLEPYKDRVNAGACDGMLLGTGAGRLNTTRLWVQGGEGKESRSKGPDLVTHGGTQEMLDEMAQHVNSMLNLVLGCLHTDSRHFRRSHGGPQAEGGC